jgi:hypothetical protein
VLEKDAVSDPADVIEASKSAADNQLGFRGRAGQAKRPSQAKRQ